MGCTCVSSWSKALAKTRSRPCSGLSMRSSLPIPALAFLALALAGCEVQPVVSNIAPPPAVQAETPAADTTVAETTVAENGSETGDGAGVPEIAPEAEPETAIEETDAVADPAAEQDDPAAETADTGQADPAEPETAPAIPAATAEDTGEVAGEVASVAQTGAGGSSVPMLQSRLGEADFTRTEGEVETWQYRFETCVVDYFLVVDSDTAKIVSWAWRAPVIGAQVDETACRRALAGRGSAS